MEMQLVIFLAFTSVTVVANAMLIWFAYKGFAGMVMRVSQTVTEFRRNDDTVALAESLMLAADHARQATEIAKVRLTEFGPVLDRARHNWSFSLAKIDARCEEIEETVACTGLKVRDAVAKPAYTIAAISSGVQTVLEYVNNGANET
jgi:hypothetical protein